MIELGDVINGDWRGHFRGHRLVGRSASEHFSKGL